MTGRSRPTVALMLESDGPGGAENMLLLLAEELRERGYDICPVGPKAGLGWLADQFRERGFEPEVFDLRRPIDLACLYDMLRMLRRREVDIVHGHEFTMAVYGAAAAALLRRPMVITMHGGRSYQERRRRRVALRWAIRRSIQAVAVSESTRRALEGSLGLKPGTVRVISNGIRWTPGDPDGPRRELGIREGEVLILSVGNLYPVKGHSVLLNALGRLRERRPALEWRLAVAGRGRRKDDLEASARERKIGDRVHFLGHRDDVPDLLTAADIFAMPSLSEGLPLALLEAMFAGTAIVASAVGGIPEVLEAGREALLVPPGDAKALAAALERLVAERGLRERLATAGREVARERFEADRMSESYAAIYENCLRAQNGGSER